MRLLVTAAHSLSPAGARADYVRLMSECNRWLVLLKAESLLAVSSKACDYAAAGSS
ncbi:MAG: hypothetical protein ACKONH_06825 [Planctomycetia bacterium]